MFSDEFNGLPISPIFISFFTVKPLYEITFRVLITVGTRFKLLVFETAYFYPASRFFDVPLSVFISQLTPAAIRT